MKLPFDTPVYETEAVSTPPSQGTFGIPAAEILSPGDPMRSVLYYRMAKLGSGHMPAVGSRMPDPEGLRLIHDWIQRLPHDMELEQQIDQLRSLSERSAVESERRNRAHLQWQIAKQIAREQNRERPTQTDMDAAQPRIERRWKRRAEQRAEQRTPLLQSLLRKPRGALRLAHELHRGAWEQTTSEAIVAVASKQENVAIRDLFETFLPDDQRTQRLGDAFDTKALLSLQGDPNRGRELFFSAKSLSCRNCHRVGDQGHSLGPDLDGIGKRLDRVQLLESLIDPSRDIDPKFATWQVLTASGQVLHGLLIERTDRNVRLRDLQRKEHRIPADQIEQLRPQRKSLMPDRQLSELTPQQAADLLAWLASLKEPPAETKPLESFFTPPDEWRGKLGEYRSPLRFADGRRVTSAAQWRVRRGELLKEWTELLGRWPPLVTKPEVEILESIRRETFTQHRVQFHWTPREKTTGYLLVPDGDGPHPAVITVFYEPETAIGLGKPNRDFAIQLTRRGFVTLSIGTTEASNRRTYALYHPSLDEASVQPLSMLAYAAANAWHVLATRDDVDEARIGIVGHSFGGKWAMFASCLFEKFACAVWSDPGIVFDEARPSVNYWEPWYLGYHPQPWRQRGIISPENPARGLYPKLRAAGRDLHELHALMAPRPFLVSGGSEDPPKRWVPLNHSIAVNRLLGHDDRVAMTNRPEHAPNAESNEQIYRFFERFLLPR